MFMAIDGHDHGTANARVVYVQVDRICHRPVSMPLETILTTMPPRARHAPAFLGALYQAFVTQESMAWTNRCEGEAVVRIPSARMLGITAYVSIQVRSSAAVLLAVVRPLSLHLTLIIVLQSWLVSVLQ